jgi:hypothetical protein
MGRAMSLRRNWVVISVLLPGMLGLAPVPGTAGENGEGTPGRDLILELHAQKQRVYLNEAVPLSVVLLADSVPVRNIAYPKLKAFAGDIADFAAPRQMNVSRDGRDYSAYEFTATLTPSRTGQYRLGPAELTCDVPAAAGGASAFFGSSEPRVVRLSSEPLTVTVLPLPTKGRPADFGGAVGRFTVSRTVVPVDLRQGDPLTVTTRIRGVGNIGAFSCASIDLPGVRGYPPRAIRTHDSLACEQTLVADAADFLIPAVGISFFDPSAGRYVARESDLVAVRVRADRPKQNDGQPASTTNRMASPAYPAESMAPLRIAAVAGVVVAASACLLLLVRLLRRAPPAPRVEALDAGRNYLIEAEAARARDDAEAFYLAAFRLLQIEAAIRSNPPEGGIAVGAADSRVSQAWAGESDIDPLASLFRECDAVRYGRQANDQTDMARILGQLQTLRAAHA